MKKNRFILIALFSLLLPLNVQAMSLIIQVMQHDSSAQSILETTRIFEESLVDVFFENGLIVSDTPIFVAKNSSTDADETKRVLSDAASGYMDFLVTVTVDFERDNLLNPEAAQLAGMKKIGWQCIYVPAKKIVSSGTGIPAAAFENDDKNLEIKQFASEVAKQIKQGLKK